MKLKKITAIIAAAVIFISNTAYAFDVNMNDGLLKLVNDSYVISNDNVGHLVDITRFMPSNKKGIMLREEAAWALEAMYNDMVAEGLAPVAVSGYRNKEYQRRLFDREVFTQKNTGAQNPTESASLLTAVPDTSEHQMGLAVDISNNSMLSESFESTREGIWLAKNSWKYGFILRYARKKSEITEKSYEPWHFRYVGKPHAEYMTKYNLVLEEYIAKLHTHENIEMVSALDNRGYRIVCTTDTAAEFENIISVSDDNAGRYIITTLADVVEEAVEDEPITTPNPTPQVSRTETMKKGFSLWWRNTQLKLEQIGRYIKEVAIPSMNEARKSFEHGVEKVINKIFEPVYIGGKN